MKKTISMILAALLIAASLASCRGSNEENTTEGNKININTNQTTEENDSDITEDNTVEKTEENSSEAETDKVVDKNSDPGEHEYIQQNDIIIVMTPGNVLPFRSGSFEYIGEFTNGTMLRRIAISEDGRWSKIVVGDIEGYVATRNVTTYNPADNGFTEFDTAYTAAVTINVRIYPGFPEGADNSESLCNLAGQIAEGSLIEIVAYDETLGWYKINYTPAEGVLSGDYAYEFFIKADDSYFVETKEEETTEEVTTEEPEPDVIIPDGYTEHIVHGISFAIPTGFGSFSNGTMLMGGSNKMITISKKDFSESYKNDFTDSLAKQGLTISSTETDQTTVGEYTVYIVSCVSNPESSSPSYDSLVCVKTSDTECVNIIITEMGSKSDIVDVIVETLIVKG